MGYAPIYGVIHDWIARDSWISSRKDDAVEYAHRKDDSEVDIDIDGVGSRQDNE